MSGMPWVKLYTEMLDDVKLVRLTDQQKWRFVQLILLAAECDAGGALVTGDSQMTTIDIAWRLRCDEVSLSQDIAVLTRAGLLFDDGGMLIISKFVDRQGPTQANKREQWRKRQQARRDRIKLALNVTHDSPVTTSNVTGGEKSREEEEKISNNSLNQSNNETHFWCTNDDIQSIYTGVTTFIAFPSKDREQIMEIIDKIASSKGSVHSTIEYLSPFFAEWKTRKSKNGRPYNPMSCGWLDWAVSGTMPGIDEPPEKIAYEVF